MITDILPARDDGVCVRCLGNLAVTTDRRFCKKCLKKVVVELSPGSTVPRGIARSADHKVAYDKEPSPWQEHAVRCLEGD